MSVELLLLIVPKAIELPQREPPFVVSLHVTSHALHARAFGGGKGAYAGLRAYAQN